MLTLKLPQWVWILIFIVIGVLLFSLIRGCKQSKMQVAENNTLKALNGELQNAIASDRSVTDSSNKLFKDTLEFERGQRALIEAQKQRTEAELQDITQENKTLIARHKLGQYTDTSSVTVPGEFVSECQGCFVKLEKTTDLVEKYKKDVNNLQNNWDNQTAIYQKRFKELDAEKLGFYNKINTLAKEQQKVIDQLKPHGRLYLTWGVLWSPLPTAAGAGVMYQNKRNLIWGATWYYGSQGTTVQTTINFPLSLKLK